MAEISCTLYDGLAFGKDVLKEVVLREVTAGDVIEAQEESEKLVQGPGGPVLVSSPTLAGLGVLRRQVLRICDVSGPLSLSDFKRMTVRDMNLLEAKARELEAATAAALARETGVGGDGPGR